MSHEPHEQLSPQPDNAPSPFYYSQLVPTFSPLLRFSRTSSPPASSLQPSPSFPSFSLSSSSLSSLSPSVPIPLSYAPMSPIHFLPVELLTRIFQSGIDHQPLPDDRDPSVITFEVSISHVCRHWRHVSLNTPHLWSTLHLRAKVHMTRCKVYLARSARLPIDIYIDTCSEDTHRHRKDLLFRKEFLSVANLLLPHIRRWREFHLKVADLHCKALARKVLSSCGSAPLLRTLQLWHVQNYQTPERLFTAIGPPPVIVFEGQLPSLKHIQLQGVNLPWSASPFLSNLSSIEYAVHSDDVRMPFNLWRTMLDSSPNLHRLSLCYSGPRAKSSGVFPPDGIEWWGAPSHQEFLPGTPSPPSAAPVLLKHLKDVQLLNLDPDYLIALSRTFEAPNTRTLHLELDWEEQDFSPFIRYLVAHSDSESGTTLADGDGQVEQWNLKGGNGVEKPSVRTVPKFPVLEHLLVSALSCGLDAWRALLKCSPGLTRLEADFARMPEGAFDVLFETVCTDSGYSRGLPPVNGVRKGEGAGSKDTLILPALRELRVAGVSGKRLADLARLRRTRGCRIRLWEVEEGGRDDEGEELARELEAVSAQWRAEEEEKDRTEGIVRPPWRWDVPVERLVWHREDVDEYDEEESEEEQEEERILETITRATSEEAEAADEDEEGEGEGEDAGDW